MFKDQEEMPQTGTFACVWTQTKDKYHQGVFSTTLKWATNVNLQEMYYGHDFTEQWRDATSFLEFKESTERNQNTFRFIVREET